MSFCGFSSLLSSIVVQLSEEVLAVFLPSAIVVKKTCVCVCVHLMNSSPKVLDLDGCFSIRDGETTIKIKFALLRGVGLGGREENRPKNAVFRGKRHDNKISNLQIYC